MAKKGGSGILREISLYHVAACFHTGPILSNNRRKKKKKKKKKKEKETDRGRDRLSRLEDTSSFSWKRHWQNGSLGRTASRGFRESSTWKESKIKWEREREKESARIYTGIYAWERKKEREHNPSLSPYTFLSRSLPLSSSYPLDRSSSLAVVTPQIRPSFSFSLSFSLAPFYLAPSRPLSVILPDRYFRSSIIFQNFRIRFDREMTESCHNRYNGNKFYGKISRERKLEERLNIERKEISMNF